MGGVVHGLTVDVLRVNRRHFAETGSRIDQNFGEFFTIRV
jgi:hypothetical protein